MADSILKKHQLDITVGVELNDAQRKATSTQIKNMASQWQDMLDDAIKKGIEDGARSASLKDVLTQFNAQLRAFKLEPLTITVDELQIMDKPIEHAAKLVIQKLGDSFKGGGLGNIISSEITDSLDIIGGAVDKIYQKMEQGAKKSAGNMIRSMEEVSKAASKITKNTDKQDIQRALSGRMEATTDKTGKSDPKRNYQALYNTSKNMVETDDNFVEKYKADIKFSRNFEKLSEAQRKEFYGKELADVTAHYNKLQETIHQKMIVLNDILADVGFTDKKGKAYVHQGGEPWAREKTLQEVKNILSGGLTVKDGGRSSLNQDGKNLNSAKPEKNQDAMPNTDPTPEHETKPIKTKTPEVDTSAFNKELFDAIEKLSGELQELYKQMFADDINDEQFDKISNSITASLKNFVEQFKFNDTKKVVGYLKAQSDDMGGWDSKKIHKTLSKQLSPEDPSWPKIESSPDTAATVQAETDALAKNTKAVKENANAKEKAKDELDEFLDGILGETKIVEKNIDDKKRDNQIANADVDAAPVTQKTIVDNVDAGSSKMSDVDSTVLANLNTVLTNLVTTLNQEKTDVKAAIDAAELSGVLHDGTPYVVDIQEQKNETINNSDITSIFRELSQLTYEKVGMLNSTTRSISDEFIVGENGRANGSFKGTDGYDTMFHNHPDVEAAVPSAKDLDTFVKKFDNFKKQLIIAGNEVASFDFSKLSSTQLTDIVDIIKSRIKEVKFDKTYMQDVEQYLKEHQGQYEKEELAKRANVNARNKWQQRVIQDMFAAHPGVMSVHNIDDFVQMQNPSHDNANSQVFNKLNEVLSNLTTILANTNRENVDSEENNKVSIDTEGLQGVLTAITFKVQDVSEKEQINSAIDQESINSLVGAIKASITPQSDGENKSTAPWAKDETLRNITGKTLGKIANSMPKVDVKGLATNDVLNRVAQATEAINNKISGRISGDINGPAAAQKSQLFDSKVQSRVSALQTKYTKLDASGQLTPEISNKIMGLWDNLDQVKTQPEFSLWLQQLQQVENEIQQIITLNKLNEQETKDSVGEIIAITKQYHDALIRAEKAKNPELQQFWTDEANKAWAEQERMQQDIEAETGKRVDLTKQEIKLEQQLGAIRADKAGKAKAAQEKKDLADHNNAVQKLIDDYEELGRLRAQRDAMPDSTERMALQQEIKSKGAKLRRQSTKLGVNTDAMKNIADMAQNEEAATIAARKHKKEYDELIAKIKERNKEQEKLAGADKDSKFAKDVQARIDGMNGEIDLIQQKIKLTKEEQAEVDKLNKKRDNAVNDKSNKKQDQADAKRLREEIKEARKQNNLDIADSTYNSARKTMASLWQLDPSIDPQSIPQVQALQVEMTKLDATYKQINDKVRAGQTLSDEEIRDLQDTSAATAQKTAQLKELIKSYTDLQNGETIGQYVGGAGSEQEQLLKAINDRFGGKAKIKEYQQNANGTLTAVASVKTGTRAFTEYSVAVSQADKKIKMLTGTTKQLPGFFDNVKRKFYEITQYVSAMSLISRATQELRKGIQYVRDIDLALTELKKVTNETEETYDKFLDTASKTAAKVGSTIKDVISSTADWARLGYSMEQAAKFAESTQILMNVSEFTDVSRATDTLISAVQAFGYTAETSMEVVDLLNTIGNNYAISTADLASSLTKSSASLVAAGGDLAEAAALTATAMKNGCLYGNI